MNDNKPDIDPTDEERNCIVGYLRYMATLRPAAAHELRVVASDIEARFHHDLALNPLGHPGSGASSPAEFIGALAGRIIDLAPAAGLYVGITIEPPKKPV